MAPSIGQLIVKRAARDKEFKRQVLTSLRTNLAKTKPTTKEWLRINRAIFAIENLK